MRIASSSFADAAVENLLSAGRGVERPLDALFHDWHRKRPVLVADEDKRALLVLRIDRDAHLLARYLREFGGAHAILNGIPGTHDVAVRGTKQRRELVRVEWIDRGDQRIGRLLRRVERRAGRGGESVVPRHTQAIAEKPMTVARADAFMSITSVGHHRRGCRHHRGCRLRRDPKLEAPRLLLARAPLPLNRDRRRRTRPDFRRHAALRAGRCGRHRRSGGCSRRRRHSGDCSDPARSPPMPFGRPLDAACADRVAAEVAAVARHLLSRARLAIRQRVATGGAAVPIGGGAIAVRRTAAMLRVVLPVVRDGAAAVDVRVAVEVVVAVDRDVVVSPSGVPAPSHRPRPRRSRRRRRTKSPRQRRSIPPAGSDRRIG